MKENIQITNHPFHTSIVVAFQIPVRIICLYAGENAPQAADTTRRSQRYRFATSRIEKQLIQDMFFFDLHNQLGSLGWPPRKL